MALWENCALTTVVTGRCGDGTRHCAREIAETQEANERREIMAKVVKGTKKRNKKNQRKRTMRVLVVIDNKMHTMS